MSESELEGLQCYPFHLPDCVPLRAPRRLFILSNVAEEDWEKALANSPQILDDRQWPCIVSLKEPLAIERIGWDFSEVDNARIIEELLELAGIPLSPEWVDKLDTTEKEEGEQ